MGFLNTSILGGRVGSGFASRLYHGSQVVWEAEPETTLIEGNFQSYTADPYNAFTGMWGHYLAQNDTLQAESTMRVTPATFPDGTEFAWDVTPDPDWAGVNGYLHLSYGNYDDSPGVITPREVYTITDLGLTIDWTFTGDEDSGLLSECWLSPVATPSGSPTRLYEVAFFPKLSPSAISYVQGLPDLGSFTDSNGVAWNVCEGVSGTEQPYYIAYRPGHVAFTGELCFHDHFAFLIANGKITGNEWFNGFAFGVEPHHGAGTLAITQFSPSYAGAARVPWTVEDLTAAAQSDTAILLEWTPAAGATSHQYRMDGGAWTASDVAGTHTITGLTADTAYTFEVRGVNATGNGAASNTATATTGSGGEVGGDPLPAVSYVFDGNDNAITVPDNATLEPANAITHMVWAKVDATPSDTFARLYSKGAAYEVAINGTNTQSYYYSVSAIGGPVTASGTVAGQWCLFITRWEAGGARNFRVYAADGTLLAEHTSAAFAGPIAHNGFDFVLGANQNGPASGNNYKGKLAHFALWGRRLTDLELADLAAGLSPAGIPSGLVEYFPLDTAGATLTGEVAGLTATVSGATFDGADGPALLA